MNLAPNLATDQKTVPSMMGHDARQSPSSAEMSDWIGFTPIITWFR